MACHLAGVTTAVATCGTSFGTEHIKVLRRLLMDDDQMRGSVVFTFDGDAAGQKAALRAFVEDQRFVAQTFVAVEPTGLDPCDLRMQRGDDAVVELVDRRVPLFEFAVRTTLKAFDLETAEGRVGALREAAPMVAQIRDAALRPEYTRLLAGWLGMDVTTVADAVRNGDRSASTGGRSGGATRSAPSEAPVQQPAPRPTGPLRRDPNHVVEREALKCALQHPDVVADWYESVEESAYTHPSARRVHEAIAAAGYPSPQVTGLSWIDAVLEAAADDEVRRLVRELTVEPLPADAGQDARYAIGVLARLLELDASRRIDDLKGRLQRLDAGSDEYDRTFADLLALEDYRRSLREESQGGAA
jgi:DNA primase